MAERKYFVLCENDCKFEGMTKEQVIAAIAEATGNTASDCDSAFITKIKEFNRQKNLEFWVGTTAEYNALAEKRDGCFYITTDETFADDVNAAIAELRLEIADLQTAIADANNAALSALETLNGSLPLNKVLYDGETVTGYEETTILAPDVHKYNIISIDGRIYTRSATTFGSSYNNCFEFNSVEVKEDEHGNYRANIYSHRVKCDVNCIKVSGGVSGVAYDFQNSAMITLGGGAHSITKIIGIM